MHAAKGGDVSSLRRRVWSTNFLDDFMSERVETAMYGLDLWMVVRLKAGIHDLCIISYPYSNLNA